MAPLRLFTALRPSPAVAAALSALAEPLPWLRATPPENHHLTLRFIGEVTAERQDAFAAALAAVRVEPFILPVGGTGVFPSRGPAKVVWAGVGRGHPRLFQLRQRTDEALLTVDPGLAMPGFHPHFTLGRLAPDFPARALAAFLEQEKAFEAPPFRVDEFLLLASELRPGSPPAYHTLRRFPLGGGKSQPQAVER